MKLWSKSAVTVTYGEVTKMAREFAGLTRKKLGRMTGAISCRSCYNYRNT